MSEQKAPTDEEVEQAWETLRQVGLNDRTGQQWVVAGSIQGKFEADGTLAAEFLEWLRPMLMSQRQALLMQVDGIERTLGIDPTTADLRKLAKRDRMVDKGEGP